MEKQNEVKQIVAKRDYLFITSLLISGSNVIQTDFFAGNYAVGRNVKTGEKAHFVILLHSAN